MIDKIDGNKLLGNIALIEGEPIVCSAYCTKSVARTSNSGEPFIIFYLKGTDGNTLQSFMYNVSKNAGFAQNNLTHRFVEIQARVSIYGGKTVLIVDTIVPSDNLSVSEKDSFKQKISDTRIESMTTYIESLLGPIIQGTIIQDNLKVASIDGIDSGKIGAPLELLYTVIRNLNTFLEDANDNIKIPTVLGAYYAVRKYISYLNKSESSVLDPITVTKFISGVDTGISKLDPFVSEILLGLCMEVYPKSYPAILAYNEIVKYKELKDMQHDWDILLVGNEISVPFNGRNINLRKY